MGGQTLTLGREYMSQAPGIVRPVSVIDALVRAIEEAKRGDPLAPVTVVPPNVYSGLSLRRSLARQTGLANTRFMPLARVAELLGAGALAEEGRHPLSSAVRASAIRAVLESEPGAFREVAHSAVTVDALEITFLELAPLADTHLDALAAVGPRANEIVRLYRAWNSRCAAFYDESDLGRAAAAAVASDAASLRDLGTVILYIPLHIDPTLQPLVEALEAKGQLTRVELWLTDDRPTVERMVVAPTPEEEVRVAVRSLPGLVDAGIPLHRVAFVSLDVEPYATIAADVLAEAGIPCHGPSTRTLAHTVAGRVLLGFLGLPGQGFSRHDVAAWFHAGPIVGDGGHLIPAERWDRCSRQAGVTGGERQWRERLEGFANRTDARAVVAADEDDAERHAHLVAAASEARDLATFMRGLIAALSPPSTRTWAAWGEWATRLVHRYLGGDLLHTDWPDHEIEALRSVEGALDSLAVLDGIEGAPGLAGFRSVVERELRSPAPRTTRFGDGVFVGRVSDLVGCDFDAVHVLGMVEGTFPSRRPAGLITDAERAPTGGLLESIEAARERQRNTWLAALKTPTHRVLSTPAGDPRVGRARQPAPWFLEAAETLHGAPVYAETLTDIDADWLEIIPSAEAGLRSALTPASLGERDALALLAGDVVEGLERGYEAITARAASVAGPWEGFVGTVDDVFSDRVLSATSLETWAACPFRYFLGHVLRVDALDEPEEIESLAATDRGSLVHEVLEQFVREESAGMAVGAPWSDSALQRLDEILAAKFAEWEEKGRTGRAVLWELEQRRIRRIINRFVVADNEQRAQLAMRTKETELGFKGPDVLEVPLADGRVVHIRGSIDRVDANDDESKIHVIDYKTGSPIASPTVDPFEDDPFREGTKLQLAVYGLAARRRYPGASVRSDYWYLSDRAAFKPEGYDVTDDVAQEFTDVLSQIVAGIEGGVFPANPGDETYHPARGHTYEHCCWCDYDRVCGADRSDAWQRLASGDAVAPYIALAPAEPEDPE